MGIFKELMQEARRQIFDIPIHKTGKKKGKGGGSVHYHIHNYWKEPRPRGGKWKEYTRR